MKKRIPVIVGLALAVLLIALAVFYGSFRKITVASGAQYVDQCPRCARPGREVTVTTAVVSDGEIHVSGVEGTYTRPGVYVFVMPDADVQIRVTVTAYPDGA